MPKGRLGLNPVLPTRDLASISAPTVLLARSGVDRSAVRQLTWPILSVYRSFIPFYTRLLSENPSQALTTGLQSLDPSARDVIENGDPTQVWVRSWKRNADFQAGVFILLGTSIFGYFFRYWVRQRS